MPTNDGERGANVRPGPALISWEEIESMKVPPGYARIQCSRCGGFVSNPLPTPIYVRGFIECPKCLQADRALSDEQIDRISELGSVEQWCREQDPRLEPTDVVRVLCTLALG